MIVDNSAFVLGREALRFTIYSMASITKFLLRDRYVMCFVYTISFKLYNN